MSLKHVLLGMLTSPHSGYDLKKTFDQSLRNFWNAELSQIYPLLQKMEQDGLLTSERQASASGPPRRVYSRSAKGRRELLSWLTEGPTVGEERIGYLAQVFFLDQLGNTADAIAFMQELRDYMTAWLESLQDAEKRWRADDPRFPDNLPDEDFYPHLTLALGLKKVQANVDWCNECIERLKVRNAAELPEGGITSGDR